MAPAYLCAPKGCRRTPETFTSRPFCGSHLASPSSDSWVSAVRNVCFLKILCLQLTKHELHRLHVWRSHLQSSETVRQKRAKVNTSRSIVMGAQRRRRTLMYLKKSFTDPADILQFMTHDILHKYLWLLVSTARLFACGYQCSAPVSV